MRFVRSRAGCTVEWKFPPPTEEAWAQGSRRFVSSPTRSTSTYAFAREHASGLASSMATPQATVEACHQGLGPTRGVVMAVLPLAEGGVPSLDLAAVSNIAVQLVQPHSERRFGRNAARVHGRDRIARVDRRGRRALARAPITIAHQLAVRFARDVLVLVAK